MREGIVHFLPSAEIWDCADIIYQYIDIRWSKSTKMTRSVMQKDNTTIEN